MAYESLQRMVDESRQIVFFGGAGVSTESGIPDFRSVDGLYNQKYDWPPETILSHTFFMKKPEEFFRFYRDKMLPLEATQNIDGLHQAAGSKKVFELHGSIHRNYCMKCGKFYPPEYIRDSADPIPLCSCGGRIKPDVVLYEEGLDNDVVSGAVSAISRADMLIVAGTSLTVYPAAGLVRYFRGSRLVLINRDATPMDSECNLVIHDKVGEVLSSLK